MKRYSRVICWRGVWRLLIGSKSDGGIIMLNLKVTELQDILKQLELAIHWHEEWFVDLTRTIICRLPYEHSNVVEDAHHHCQFGKWYYGSSIRQLLDHPAFIAIEDVHCNMHKFSARLLLASSEGLPSPVCDYDNFRNSKDNLVLEIKTLRHEIEQIVYSRDPLTGAENRIGMLSTLRELHELVKRRTFECSLVMIDLDHFKTINDNFGHPVGDQVLISVVQNIKSHLRPYDRVYRYGGEEFLISLPDTSLQEVQAVIERIRISIASITHGTSTPDTFFITASFGISPLDATVSVEESVNRADIALYSAKLSGRNRICVWEPSMTTCQEESLPQ